MPPRRPQAGSALSALTRQQRYCIESGNFAELVFDSPEHHAATWQAVRDELLAWYAKHRRGELPSAWYEFDAEPRFGPRLQIMEGVTRRLETAAEYLQRIGQTWQSIFGGQRARQ